MKNFLVEIVNNKVESAAVQDETGKWQGVISYASNHPTLAGECLLETVPIYDSEQEAKNAMDNEIAALRQFVKEMEELYAAEAAKQAEANSTSV